MEKYKILLLSDHALSTSGVGCQSRFLVEGLIKKGCWTVRQFGAAVKHDNYDVIEVNPDFIIKPIDGFGNRQMKNQDITIGCNISIEEVYTGKNVIATYRLNNGSEQTVDIKVPRGVNNGDRIRYGGMGQQDIQGAPHGDLYVIINIVNTGNFQINGDDLMTTRKVGVLDLVVGVKVNIDLPDKSAVMLNVPKGTQPNTVFSINGRGLPNRKTGRSGNVLVKILGDTPSNLDEQVLQDIEQIRRKIS